MSKIFTASDFDKWLSTYCMMAPGPVASLARDMANARWGLTYYSVRKDAIIMACERLRSRVGAS